MVTLPVRPDMPTLTASELFFAFMDAPDIGPIDFVKSPDYCDAWNSKMVFPKSKPILRSQDYKIYYKDLGLFSDYYEGFCKEHTSNLKRQAAVGEFSKALLSVHGEYRALFDDMFKVMIPGVVLSPDPRISTRIFSV
jgi:hypothetical protein